MSLHFYYQSSTSEPSLNPPLIPIDSRAFLFGDHAYEVVRTYQQIPFAAEEHFNRLLESLDYLNYTVYPTFETFCKDLHVITKFAYQTLKLSDELYIRIHFGRNPDHRVSLAPDPSLVPLWVYICSPLQSYTEDFNSNGGMRLAMSTVFRNLNTSFSPNAKTGNYLNNMLGCMSAKERGFDDAVFLNPADNTLCEGSTFNIAFIDAKGEMVFMDPGTKPPYLLGITQRVFTDTSGKNKPPWRYEKVTIESAKEFPYAFVLSTTKELQWVSLIEDIQFKEPSKDILEPYFNYFQSYVKNNIQGFQKKLISANA